MTGVESESHAGGLIASVKSLLAERIGRISLSVGMDGGLDHLVSGKMLRTRFGVRMAAGSPAPLDRDALVRACAATEMVHSASLCHDDVIDNALLRRNRPTLWKTSSPSAAVLIGDLLSCEATDLILGIGEGRLLGAFVAKVREVCASEVEQELRLSGRRMDEETCLRVARGKTGPLFAFLGRVCGGEDASLASAAEEAGYRIGTAYQLADDLLDVSGDERVAGKTLGTDLIRRKFTLPLAWEDGSQIAWQHIDRLCGSSLDGLAEWPGVRAALAGFVAGDFRPAIDRQVGRVNAGA